jgi:hypothetical protein
MVKPAARLRLSRVALRMFADARALRGLLGDSQRVDASFRAAVRRYRRALTVACDRAGIDWQAELERARKRDTPAAAPFGGVPGAGAARVDE